MATKISRRKTPGTEMENVENSIGYYIANKALSSERMAPMFQQAAQTKNPMGSLALALSHAVLGAREKMIQKGILSSDNIWAADNGVIDQLVTQDNPAWEQAGIYADPMELKSEVFGILEQFDKAGKDPSAKAKQPQQSAAMSTKGALY